MPAGPIQRTRPWDVRRERGPCVGTGIFTEPVKPTRSCGGSRVRIHVPPAERVSNERNSNDVAGFSSCSAATRSATADATYLLAFTQKLPTPARNPTQSRCVVKSIPCGAGPGGIALVLTLDLSACTNPYDLDQRANGGFVGAGAGAAIGGCGGRRDRRSIRWHRRRGNRSATATAILNGSRERHHHRI